MCVWNNVTFCDAQDHVITKTVSGRDQDQWGQFCIRTWLTTITGWPSFDITRKTRVRTCQNCHRKKFNWVLMFAVAYSVKYFCRHVFPLVKLKELNVLPYSSVESICASPLSPSHHKKQRTSKIVLDLKFSYSHSKFRSYRYFQIALPWLNFLPLPCTVLSCGKTLCETLIFL